MDKHLLVTVSEQRSALFGVRFVGNFFSNKKNMRITLYYSHPRATIGWDDAMGRRQQAKQKTQNEARGRQALEEAKKECLNQGFKDDQISFKLEIRKGSKVMDILNEGAKGNYDAVVLGMRGVTWLEEAFDESVTKGFLKEKFYFPVWLCKKPETNRKNVLLCVDGSDASNRIADHVGFILQDENQQDVTIFIAGKNPGQAENIVSSVRANLVKNGLSEARLTIMSVPEKNASKAIIEELKKNEYSAVAVGRKNIEQKGLKKMFLGSVSTQLYNELEGASLWICY